MVQKYTKEITQAVEPIPEGLTLEDLWRFFVQHRHHIHDQTQTTDVDPVALVEEDEIKCNARLSKHFYVTLTDDRTLMNPIGLRDGVRYVFEVIQDGTGGRLLTLDTKFTFSDSIPSITLSTDPDKRDFIGCIYRAKEDLLYVVAFEFGY